VGVLSAGERQKDLSMTSMRTLSMAAFLAAGMAGSVLAATGDNTGQGVTITPTSPTMSTQNVPSQDGSNQLGHMSTMKGRAGVPDDPASSARAGSVPSDATNPSNNPNCAGVC